MQIAIHLGAHCTDEDLILKTLTDNSGMLQNNGVLVPPGGKARPAIRKAMQGRGNLVPGLGNPLMQELLDHKEAERIVLSYEGFLGTYAKVLAGARIYGDIAQRVTTLRDIFPGHEISFYLGIRNPATFIPALFEASSATDFNAFVAGHDMAALTWSTPVADIVTACPDVPLTVWCNEDLPLIWPTVLRKVSAVEAEMKGDTAILQQIMTAEGFRRLQSYLRDNPAQSQTTWRKVVTAFLGKYADDSAVAPDIALPGWSEAMIVEMSAAYERDVAAIRQMDNLTFIAP